MKPLIPDSYALPLAALNIGVSIEEAQRMVDRGDLDPTSIRSVLKAEQRRRAESPTAFERMLFGRE